MSEPPSQLDAAVRHNARIGMILFIIYLVIYAGFVGLSAFALDLMKTQIIAGVNLAVVYGFALIVLALVLAMVYMYLCRSSDDGKGGQS